MIGLQLMMERAARQNPDGLCLRYRDVSRNWGEVAQRVARLAGGLQQLGVAAGDRVAILSLNCGNYYEVLFAVPWAGGCVVPLNTRWALPENEYALTDSGASVLFFDDAFLEQAETLREQIGGLRQLIYLDDGDCPSWALDYEQLITGHAAIPSSDRVGDEMAGIFYTGGTTGFPKGVMQSHRAIWASAISTVPEFAMSFESRYLHVAPMFHMADLAGSMGAALAACGNVVLQVFDPAAVLQTIERERVTHALLVPAMIKALLAHPDIQRRDLSSLHVLMYGASPMPAATLERFMQLLPHVGLVQGYGQTELAPIATILSKEDHRRGGDLLRSAGRPACISDIRCVKSDGSDCDVGEEGEIAVRGPQTMIGYWNKPEQTAAALRDGWVFTGDVGYFGDTGHLYIVDRVKDMIVTGGENVFTTEVENAIMTHAAVQDVAVIGIPSEQWGESVHAIIILKAGQQISEEDIRAHCRAQIAGYKVPKSVEFRDEPLPLSGAGKVLKTELRKPYWEGRERAVN